MRPLSGLDAAFLYAETPHTPMNVLGTLLLDAAGAGPGWSSARVVEQVVARAPRLAPLRRRLAEAPLGLDHPVWVDDPHFDPRRHVLYVQAPSPGSERVLDGLVARIAARPLDRSRPLWELWVIEGLEGGRVGLVMKLHHAVADGVAGAALLLQLLDGAPQLPAADAREECEAGSALSDADLLGHTASRLARRPGAFVRALDHGGRAVLRAARSARSGRRAGEPPALPLSAPRTCFNRSVSPYRAVATERVPRADLERVKRTFQTTLNDVVLAACSLSLRRWLADHGGVPAAPLVATVPVSVRAPGDLFDAGNRVSALFVHLPVHLDDPLDHLVAVSRQSRRAKQLHAALGRDLLGEWAELAVPALFRRGARLYGRWRLAERHRPFHNLVISNVPGPRELLRAAGAPVVAAHPYGPVLEGAGLNITVLSYADTVGFGVLACRESVPDVWDLATGFGAAARELVQVAHESVPAAPPDARRVA